MPNSQFNKVKSGMKNGTEVTLTLSSNVTDNSKDEGSFSHKLILTDIQLYEAFVNT